MVIDTLRQDLRYGLRQLQRAPLFTIIASLSIAIGVIVAVSAFSLINALLFKPMPVPDGEGIYHLYTSDYDGRTERARTIQVSVGNGRYYGGGLAVEASARADDGRLDVYSLEVPHWWHLIRLAPALRRGTQRNSRYVRSFATTELSLRTRRRHEVNADGELVTSTPAHFRIHPAAIRVFVPA